MAIRMRNSRISGLQTVLTYYSYNYFVLGRSLFGAKLDQNLLSSLAIPQFHKTWRQEKVQTKNG